MLISRQLKNDIKHGIKTDRENSNQENRYSLIRLNGVNKSAQENTKQLYASIQAVNGNFTAPF